jgi:hypothetical protein
MVPIGVPEPQITEKAINMSPMDLFDSIFWGMYSMIFGEAELMNYRSISGGWYGSNGV